MKDLLKSLSTLSEGETKDTKTGRVHKGTYGSEYDTDKEGNEVKKAAPDVKKGRGRPKKDADSSGEVKKYDTSTLGNVFGGGKKPSKSVGTVSKKHSLKEFIESVEDTKHAEAVMEGMFGGVDHSSVAANLGKLARVIKSVQTPEQFAVAQKYARRMKGTIMNHQHDKMGFGSGLRANLGVMRDVDADLKAKAQELGIDFQPLEETGEQVEIKPASQTQTQVIQQGDKTLGTVSNPQLANQIKQAIGQGQMSLSTDEIAEGKAKPDFLDVDKDDNKKESFKKAVKDKEEKKKVDESRDFAASEYTDEQIGKILAREKPGMDTNSDDFYSAVYHELIQMGLTPKAARYKLNQDEDFMGDVASSYSHFQENPTLDEGTREDFTQHALAKPTSSFTKPGSSMAQPKGTPTKINRPVPEPTPWSTDPISAASDRAFNFIDSLGKGTKFTKEGTEMKDIQLENWESQLNSLLTEGITVSSSQGQQGAPDSVSVTATETDADALLSVLRNAGIGGFGAEPQAPEVGYGVAQGGEEEFDGTGTEPQPAPGVVGDDNDMLSMLKKMAGLSGDGGAEVVAIGGEEGGQDYEDEEGSEEGGEEQAQTLEPAGGEEEGSDEESGEEAGSEEESDEEQTDEGNAFTGKLKQTPQGGEFKMGDKEYKDTSAIEEAEGECDECGMLESQCGCEHEQVEENFANSANDPAQAELAKLKALLSMGNDMHRMKQSQAMGNPIRVAEADTLSQWKKLSGI